MFCVGVLTVAVRRNSMRFLFTHDVTPPDSPCSSRYLIPSAITANNSTSFNSRTGISTISGEIGKISEFRMTNDSFLCSEPIITEYHSNTSDFIYMHGWACLVHRASYVAGHLRIPS